MVRTFVSSLLLLLTLAFMGVHASARTNRGCVCTDKCESTVSRRTEWYHVDAPQCSSKDGSHWGYCNQPEVPVVPLMTCGKCNNGITFDNVDQGRSRAA